MFKRNKLTFETVQNSGARQWVILSSLYALVFLIPALLFIIGSENIELKSLFYNKGLLSLFIIVGLFFGIMALVIWSRYLKVADYDEKDNRMIRNMFSSSKTKDAINKYLARQEAEIHMLKLQLRKTVARRSQNDKRMSPNDDIYSLFRFNTLLSQLERQKTQASRIAINNLIAGVVFTIIACGVIIWFFFISQSDIKREPLNFIIYSFSRLSFAIFIQIFAYFFLRLYKANLNQVTYYQNEMTNCQLKMIALIESIKSKDKDAIRKTLEELSRTERNPSLKRGDTTREIESDKNESEYFLKTMETVIELYKSSTKK